MKTSLRIAVLAASLAWASAPAAAYTTLFAFGDSLSDAGNLYKVDLGTNPLPPYQGGHFSNGSTWVEDLSDLLGVGTLKPSLSGGRDFAFAGAQTGPTAIEGANPADLLGQVTTYAIGHRGPEVGALYTLEIGGNDIMNALSEYASRKISIGTVGAVVAKAETNTVDAVDGLFALGARSLLFYEVPNLGIIPRFRFAGATMQNLASGLALSFDDAVLRDLRGLEADGLRVYDLQTYSLIDQARADPRKFGLTDVVDPCWTGGFNGFAGGGTLCSDPNQYLFWDGVHPTAYAHALTAVFACDALPAGSCVALPSVLAASASTVAPEPSTWGLMLLGFAGLLFVGSRGVGARRAEASVSSLRRNSASVPVPTPSQTPSHH
jgi:phospholipase/lecithinase/hemolysin